MSSKPNSMYIQLLERRGILESILIAAAALPYLNSLNGPWILDDNPIIALNQYVTRSTFWGYLWTSDYWATTGAATHLFRPFTMMTYAVTWHGFGNWTLPFHTTNIALHAAITLIVWRLFLAGLRTLPALVAGIFFAVHPIHAEAVANVVGRSELLLAILFLVTLSNHRRQSTALNLSAEFFASFAMLLSKETGLALLLYLPIEDLATGRTRLEGRRQRLFCKYMALGLATIAYLLLRSFAVGTLPGESIQHTVGDRFALTTSAAAQDAKLLLFPLAQRAVWQIPSLADTPLVSEALGLVIIFLFAAALPIAVVRKTTLALPLSLIAVSFLPLLHVIPNNIWVWERGLYVPSIGLVWGIFLLLSSTQIPARARKVGLVGLSLLAVYFTFRTAMMSTLYADDLRFWQYQNKISPDDNNALFSLSDCLGKRGDMGSAIKLREAALARDGNRAIFVQGLAAAYLQGGRRREAADLLTSASKSQLTFQNIRQQGQILQLLAHMAREAGVPGAEKAFLTQSRIRELNAANRLK